MTPAMELGKPSDVVFPPVLVPSVRAQVEDGRDMNKGRPLYYTRTGINQLVPGQARTGGVRVYS